MADRETNRKICERYPFLIPRNAWSGRRITDGAGFFPGSPEAAPEYDYEFTELDDIPDGWLIAFGEQFCEELRDYLEKRGLLDDFRFTQIKEKYGALCIYASGLDSEGWALIEKYEDMSRHYCIRCGKPATRVTTGWISPYCDDCVPSRERSVPIEEWFKRMAGEEGSDTENEGEEVSQDVLW